MRVTVCLIALIICLNTVPGTGQKSFGQDQSQRRSQRQTLNQIRQLKSVLQSKSRQPDGSKKVQKTKFVDSQPLRRPNQEAIERQQRQMAPIEQPTPMLVDGSNPPDLGDRPESSQPLVANEAAVSPASQPTEAALWFHMFLANEQELMPMASFRSTGRMTFEVPYVAGFSWHVKVTTSEGEVRR